MSESELYGAILTEATRLGHRMFRNSVGRARYRSAKGDTFTVPYGLSVGSSDLIGWTRIAIGVERTVAVFTACEIKLPGKRATKEQQAFIRAVQDAGGIAGVCTSVSDYRKLIGAEA